MLCFASHVDQDIIIRPSIEEWHILRYMFMLGIERIITQYRNGDAVSGFFQELFFPSPR